MSPAFTLRREDCHTIGRWVRCSLVAGRATDLDLALTSRDLEKMENRLEGLGRRHPPLLNLQLHTRKFPADVGHWRR